MYFRKINLENLEIIDNNTDFLTVKYNDNPLYIETPEMYVPFGLEKEYNNFIIKLQFNRNNEETIDFYNFILELEDKIKELLNTNSLKSEIVHTNKKFDPLLKTKILCIKNSINIDYKKNNEFGNIYDFEKKTNIKAFLMIDNLFRKNSNYYCKFKLKKIIEE